MWGLEGSGPIKDLKMNYFYHELEALEMLVKWPKELHTFTFENETLEYWPWKSFQPILETQMSNLRELTITHFRECEGDVKYLDLTGFTVLERLSLTTALTGFNICHIPRIVALNLQFLTWQVTDSDGKNAIFMDRHEIWLRAMVEFAATEQQKLKSIFVELYENNPFYLEFELESDFAIYPWVVLDNINQDAERVGIRVRYEMPYMSREEFVYLVERKLGYLANKDSQEDGHTSLVFTEICRH